MDSKLLHMFQFFMALSESPRQENPGMSTRVSGFDIVLVISFSVSCRALFPSIPGSGEVIRSPFFGGGVLAISLCVSRIKWTHYAVDPHFRWRLEYLINFLSPYSASFSFHLAGKIIPKIVFSSVLLSLILTMPTFNHLTF